MSIKLKRYIGAVVGAAFVCGGVMAGCGTTNNDQGTSFLATGYYANPDPENNTGLSGANVLLAPDLSAIGGVQGILNDDNDIFTLSVDGGQLVIFMGLENRLSTQFLRVVRVDCSYHIPGAAISVPDDSYNSSFVIPQGGTVVDGNVTEPGLGRIGFEVLSTDILSYLNVNRNSLPALPFRMTATCRAVSVSQAGDVFTSNDLVFPMTMVEEAEGSGSTVGGISATTTTSTTTSTTTTTM